MYYPFRTAVLAMLIFAAQSPDRGAAQPPATELEEVEVVGRATDLTGVADAASEGRVGHLEITARPILRVGEILEVIPGFIATQHSGTGKANQYFLRGFNLDHGTDFAAKVDGIPINLPTHGHGQGYLDLNHIIPELVEVVDFKKGPYYAEVGDFSSAGSAHLHLFDALPQGIAKFGIGEDSFYRGVLADSFRLDQGVVLGAFEVQAYDGPWENPEDGLKLNGLLKLTMGDASRGLRLSGMGYSSEWDSTDQIALRAVQDGRVGRLGALNPTNGGETDRYSLSLEGWKDHGAVGQTRGLAYITYYDFSLWSDFTYFLDDPINGDQFRQFDERVYLGGELSHQVWSEWNALEMQHRAGLQLRHDIIDEVGLEKTVARRFLSTVRSDSVDQTSVGLFYQNTTYWTPRLRSVIGVRGDAYFFDVSDSNIPDNNGSEEDVLASPKGSVAYTVAHATEVYVSGGFGFHSNDGRGTTTVIDPNTGERVTPVDPLVESKGAEIGLRTAAWPGLQSTVALWYLELDSELLFVGDAGTTEPSGASERYGLEWANFYRVNDWLTLDFDLAYVDAEFSDEPSDANEIPGAIPLVIATGAAVQLDNGLFGSLRLRHLGEYPLIEDDSVQADSTSLVNLQVGYQFKQRPIAIYLDVLNLFDAEDNDIEYYYASRLPGEPADGIEDVHFHPVEPRTFRGYLAMRF